MSSALADLVCAAAVSVARARGLDVSRLPDEVVVTRPRNPAHGDFATNLPLLVADDLGVDAVEFACWLSAALSATASESVAPVAAAQAAGAGFVNLWLSAVARVELLTATRLACADSASPMPTLPPTEPECRAEFGSDVASYLRLDSTVDRRRFLRQDEANPVFLLQYGYARTIAALRGAAALGITVDTREPAEPEPLGELLAEVPLGRLLTDYPCVRRAAAEQPQRLARFLTKLADAYLEFVVSHPPLPAGDEQVTPAHRARLACCHASALVLADGLGLLGITAPERI